VSKAKHDRSGFGEAGVPSAWGGCLWAGRVPHKVAARQGHGVLRGPVIVPGCDGGLRRCPLLGARDWQARSHGSADRAGLVKPFVKRQKNDAADAEAIWEAAQRPTMRFAAIKSEAAQANAVVFRARDLLVCQRTQAINALRGHLAEYGLVVAKGSAHAAKLVEHVEDPACDLPDAARLDWAMWVRSSAGQNPADDESAAFRAMRSGGIMRLGG
jgi:transposase